MSEDELHYRIIMRGKEVSYVLVRATGSYYSGFDFVTEDRYPYTHDGLKDVQLMVEALTILREGV